MMFEEPEFDSETAYLLRSGRMRQLLIEASQRTEGIPFEAALEKIGIDPAESA